MDLAAKLADTLVCPQCHKPLSADAGALICDSHGAQYRRNEHGYYDFTLDPGLLNVETTSEEYAQDQEENWERFFLEYLKPWLDREPALRVLEVGSGLGLAITYLLEEGREAYGIDVPCLSSFWARHDNDPAHFFSCDGAHMPFQDSFFDAVYSLGVIEHIGTEVGHYTLRNDYGAARQEFANELIRVTRPDGRILITCPNKSFPIDIAHEPTDAATPTGTMRFRRAVYNKTGMTLHPPWGKHHLLSYGEVRALFCVNGGAREFRALSARGYFTFERFGSGPLGFLRDAVAGYVNNLPGILRPTPLNPFVIAEIRK